MMTPTTTHALMVSWTLARAQRIGLQLQAADLQRPPLLPGHRTVGHQGVVAEDEARRRLDQAVQEEQRLRQALDGALEQRPPKGHQAEGIARLSHDAGLCPDERSIVVLAFVTTISTNLARKVLEQMDGGMFNRLDAQAAIQFLDPQGPGDWLHARGYFGKRSRLVTQGLITVEWPCPTRAPSDLVAAAVSLTSRAFSIIAGLPDEAEGTEERI